VLETLVSGRECTDDDLARAANGTLPPAVIHEFIRELAANGLVIVR
jgi:hypothetical protein